MQKKYLVLQITNKKKESKERSKVKESRLANNYTKQQDISKNNHYYEWLTEYFFYEDIYCYSECEFFIDITNYQELYRKTPYQLSIEIKNSFIRRWSITPIIGMGTNLFLAKTACDIITKEKNTQIAYLDEKEYLSICSNHKPLTDFWQISHSMMLKLKKLGITTMKDIRTYPYEKLYEEFGYNAEYLINHSLGLESNTIMDLNKKTLPKTVSSSTTFESIKSRKESYYKLQKLLDFNILKLKEEGLVTKNIYLYIKYANNIIPREIIHIKLDTSTNSYWQLMKNTLDAYLEKANLFFPIEKLAISFAEISKLPSETYQIKEKKKKLSLILPNFFPKRKSPSLAKSNQMTFLHT